MSDPSTPPATPAPEPSTLPDELRAENAGLRVQLATEHTELRLWAREVESRATHSTSQLRTILDVLPVGLFIADAHGRILHYNAAAHAIWGGTPPHAATIDEYAAYRGWRPTGERIAAEDWSLARALCCGEITLNEECEIETFDGERKTILNYAAPVHDEAGAITGAVVALVDITARKEREWWTHPVKAPVT